MEHEYWKKAEEGISLDDYPEVDENAIEFPNDIYIAFAVSTKDCGNSEFIVDGSTQICDVCGKTMFRTIVRRYQIAANYEPDNPKPLEEYKGAWVEINNPVGVTQLPQS